MCGVDIRVEASFQDSIEGLAITMHGSCCMKVVSKHIRSTALGDSVFRAATGGGPKLALAQRSFCVWHSLKELKCTSTEAARRQSRIISDKFETHGTTDYSNRDIATRKMVLPRDTPTPAGSTEALHPFSYDKVPPP